MNYLRIIPIISLIVLLAAGCAASLTGNRVAIERERVFDFPGQSKDQIFDATQIWLNGHFVSIEGITEYADKGSGTITGNYVMKLDYTRNNGLSLSRFAAHVKFLIKVKEGKAKFKLYNPMIQEVATGEYGFQRKEQLSMFPTEIQQEVKSRWSMTLVDYNKLDFSEDDF